MGDMARTGTVCSRALGGLAIAAAGSAAHALRQCAPATSAQISTLKQYVDNAWQKYRRAPPEHRCCAKPCEPIIRFTARIETTALLLNAVARNPKVQDPEHSRARANSNPGKSTRSGRTGRRRLEHVRSPRTCSSFLGPIGLWPARGRASPPTVKPR